MKWVPSSCHRPIYGYENSTLETGRTYSFVWQGRHWVKSDRLYLRKSYGSLGLVHILSRLHAFILRFIHEYLYYDSLSDSVYAYLKFDYVFVPLLIVVGEWVGAGLFVDGLFKRCFRVCGHI